MSITFLVSCSLSMCGGAGVALSLSSCVFSPWSASSLSFRNHVLKSMSVYIYNKRELTLIGKVPDLYFPKFLLLLFPLDIEWSWWQSWLQCFFLKEKRREKRATLLLLLLFSEWKKGATKKIYRHQLFYIFLQQETLNRKKRIHKWITRNEDKGLK